MKLSRKIFIGAIAITFLALLFIPISRRDNTKSSIVATNFVAYDFARAITGQSDNIKLLIKPGSELHDFEPTPDDIISIQQADAIIYNGGESDDWLNDILAALPQSVKKIRMFDFVELKEESDDGIINSEKESEHTEEPDTNQEEPEYDEHIWTSPKNAAKIIRGIASALGLNSPDNYIAKLDSLDKEFAKLSPKTLIFADRFPFYYFTSEYGFNYYAAYPGCAEHAEADPKTIAKLIEYIKSSHQKNIFTIELSDQKIAKTISNATGANIRTLHSAHNISAEDFKNGTTYLDLLERNLRTLQEDQ